MNSMHEPGEAAPGETESAVRGAIIGSDEGLRDHARRALHAVGAAADAEIDEGCHALAARTPEESRLPACDLVILDLEDDPDAGIQLATRLVATNSSAAIIAAGPVLSSDQFIEAMRAGVVEYLRKPVAAEELADACARALRRRGRTPGRVDERQGELYTFFGAKGGAGSTTVATNVAIELHRITGKRTLLADLDLELGEIAAFLGIEPRFNFIDLVRNFHRMDADLLASYIEGHESGVDVLSAPFEPQQGELVSGEQILRILGFLRTQYDLVIVDASKSLAPPSLAALEAADRIFVVANVDVPSLKNLKRCLPVLERTSDRGREDIHLVLNRYDPKNLLDLDDVRETVGMDVFRSLSNDFQGVIRSISTGEPLVTNSESRYAGELKSLAATIAGVKEEGRSGLSLGSLLTRPFRALFQRSRLEPAGATDHA